MALRKPDKIALAIRSPKILFLSTNLQLMLVFLLLILFIGFIYKRMFGSA